VTLAVAIASWGSASGAADAQNSGEPYPTCTKKPSAGSVTLAKKTFELGVRYFKEADYARAILYFRDAYRSDCTAHKLLVNIARAHELRGEREDAVVALSTYVERAPDAEDREVIERRLENLKAQIAADARPAPSNEPQAPPAPAVSPADTARPLPSNGKKDGAPKASIAPWIVAGVGGATLVTGGALYLVGAGKIAEAEKTCPDRSNCPSAEARDTGNSGRTLETVGIAVGVLGVAAIGGGLAWYFVERKGQAPAAGALVPTFAPGYAGLGYAARF
jgi:hypothetical protein